MDLVISEDFYNIAKLELLVVPVKKLEKSGYVVEPLDSRELAKKIRCLRCGKNPRKRIRPPPRPKTQNDGEIAEPAISEDLADKDTERSANSDEEKQERYELQSENQKPDDSHAGGDKQVKSTDEPALLDQCYWHPEKFSNRRFPCCDGHMFSKGCQSDLVHQPEDANAQAFQQRWMYYRTPSPGSRRVRRAVALDCEMGCGMNGDEELIRISMVDYFTNEVLIDSLVFPNSPLRHCCTPWSGILMKDLYRARAARKCFMGRDRTRQEVWKHIGPDTIVIVHGGVGDLSSLRWIHTRIVDTAILEKRLRQQDRIGVLSLKKLCEVRLGLLIQQGRQGHDSLEDARGCRLLANFYANAGDSLEIEQPDGAEEQQKVKGKWKRKNRGAEKPCQTQNQ